MKNLRVGLASTLVLTALTFVAPALTSGPVSAASDLTLDVSSSGEVIADDPTLIPVTLTATNPLGGDGLPGFNATFSVIVPLGVVPSGAPAPTSISVSGSNQVLVYENVGDVQEGSTFTLDIVLEAPAADFPVASEIDIDANVFVNTDARTVPDVNPDGSSGGDTTSSASGTSTTTLVAVDIQKMSPDMNFGNEALRGVHDHAVEFQIDVFNTGQGTTGPSTVEDFIPAQVEFLGCGGVDNTTNSPSNPGSALEYPDADPLTSTAAPAGNCLAPVLVESIEIIGGTINSATATNGTAAPANVPDGVYTHVVWAVGTLPATGTGAPATSISYQAGIPLLENVYDPDLFNDGGTLGASGDPTANLDNNGVQAPGNNVPLYTNEFANEPGIANYATVAGTYAGDLAPGGDPAQSDSFEFPFTIEDLAIQKDIEVPDPLLQGGVLNYTMTIRTSEYRTITNMTVTDPISDGQCILLGGPDPEEVAGNAPFSGECAGAGPAPSAALQSLIENADGSWLMTWDFTSDPNLVEIGPSGEYILAFSTLARESYQENFVDDAPLNGGDPFENTVDIDGTSNLIDGIPDNPTFDAETIFDEGAVTFGLGIAVIDKSISEPVPPGTELNCDAASWVRTGLEGQASVNAPAPLVDPVYSYRTGDRVCYRLGVDFQENLNFRNPIVNDFLPPGMEFDQFWGVDTATGATANNTVIIDAANVTVIPDNNLVVWLLGAQDPDTIGGNFEDDLFVSNGGTRFEVIFSATVGAEPSNLLAPDLTSNLMKFNTSNINGDTISLRDLADHEFVQPNVGIEKDTPTEIVIQGQLVDYTVTVTNNFSDQDGQGNTLTGADRERARALAISNWDVLPPGIACAQISAIALNAPGTPAPVCTDGIGADGRSVIEFTIDSLYPQEAAELTYSLTLPTGISAGQTLTNNAGVRQYTGTPGTDGDPSNDVTFVPSDNIDPTLEDDANMPPALADETIRTPPATIGKQQQSQFEDSPGPGNNVMNDPPSTDLDEATIGEQVLYEVVNVSVPQGITLFNPVITDQIPDGMSFVSLSAVTVDTGDGSADDALAEGFTFTQVDGLLTVTFPTPYDNPDQSGDDIVELSFLVVIDDDPANVAGRQLRNTAVFRWETSDGQEIEAFSDDPDDSSDDLIIRIVEPSPQIEKTNDAADPAQAGVPITFTHTITNPRNPGNRGNTSNAYDLVVTDVLPAGLILDSNPDSGTVSADGRTIIWDSTTTPSLAVLQPNRTTTITYTAIIAPPAVAAVTLTNEVDLVASSLPGDVDGERTYGDDSESDVVPPEATVDKDVQPLGDPDDDDAEFTLGQPLDFDFTVTIPSGVVAYDATAFDQLPTGVTFDSFGTAVVSAECQVFDPVTATSTGVPLDAGDVALLPSPVGGDDQRIAAFFGDLAAVDGDCVITVPYTVHVNDTAAAGDTLTNEVTFVWNSEDAITDDPADLTELPSGLDDPDGDFDLMSDPASESVDVVDPQLELDQDITAADGGALVSPACDTTPGNDSAASDDADGLPTDGCDVEAGAEILKTITITNTGTSGAFDTTVVETVPEGVTPLTALGGTPVTATGDSVTGSAGIIGVWDDDLRTITWTLPDEIPAGESITIDFAAQLDASDDLADEQDFTFAADIPEYFGIPEAERDQIVADNPANDDIATYGSTTGVNPADPDEATIEVHFPELGIEKDEVSPSDASNAVLDEPYTWEIVVTNTDTVATAFDVDVTDTLPAFAALPGAWTYVAGSALVTSPNNTAVAIEPTGGPNGPLVWTDLDDLAPGETITITIQAIPNSAILAPDKPTGSANLGSDVVYTNEVVTTADDASGSPTFNDGTPITAETTDDVVIREADLSVTKAITNPVQPAPVYFGGLVEYTITVTNDGPDDATGVELTDANLLDVGDPNDTILFVGVLSVDRGAFDDATGIWTVGDVAVGETLELVVSTRMNTTNPPGQIPPAPAINEVEISAADQFDTDSDPDNAPPGAPTEDDEDLVSLDPLPSSLGNFVWLDLNGDGIQDPTEPGIPGVPVVVTFTDPGGTDRQITIITDGTGGWNVDPFFADELTGDVIGLPIDTDLVVTVDTTAPNLLGLLPTEGDESDVDGGADSTSTQQINLGGTEVEVQPDGTVGRLDVDFGYEPEPTSLGDRIWWDQDNSADDTDGVDEYGIGGVEVEIIWYGFDGLPGTDDDLVLTTVTSDGTIDVDGDGQPDPAGTWNSRYDPATGDSNREIPPGNYEVNVDATTLPAGFPINTYDLDGVATPLNVSDIVLEPGENRTDIDFSVTGEGLIGDTIFFDQNGDGVDDPTEPGISGVDVTLTWAGPDGIFGTDDDAVLTTTTDVNGNYEFPNLPDGNFQVEVDEDTLPADMTQTFDPDDELDGTSTVMLDSANGILEDLDQDFGYQGDLSIGDQIFYDVDANGSGVIDGSDVPLGGVDVTVTYLGADGIEGTADDFTTTVTTSDGTVDVNGDGTIDPIGFYQVDGLPSGDYVVTVDPTTLPNGIDIPTYDFDEPGAPDTIATPNTSSTTLDGAADLDQDFSYTAPGSIGDTVWWDRNEDGIQDPDEPGYSGVPVTVTSDGPDGLPGTDDDISITTVTSDGTTDVDGDGEIDPAGSYFVPNLPLDLPLTVTVDTTVLPPTFPPTHDIDDAADGSTAEGTPNSSTVTLTDEATQNLDVDYGYSGPGAVGDTVWLDLDSDGEIGPEEIGLPGVPVEVRWGGVDGIIGTADDIIATTTTSDGTTDVDGDGVIDPAGSYYVDGLPLGVDIQVTVDTSVLPPDLQPTYDADGTDTPNVSTVELTDEEPINRDQDFGYAGPGSIGDTLWYDVDGDGAADPAGSGVFDGNDVPLIGVEVTITYAGVNGAPDLVIVRTTDENGEYLTEGLPLGDYTITVDPATLPAGIALPTFDTDGTLDNMSTVTLDEQTPANLEQDFSYTAPGAVGDTVWFDQDGDGVVGPGEPGLVGIPVTITSPGGDGIPGTADDIEITVLTSDGSTDVDDDGEIDPAGSYYVPNLPIDVPITVTVDPTALPPGMVPTFDDDGTDTPNTSTVTLTADEPIDTDQDFGYNGEGEIGDTIWFDRDGAGGAAVDTAGGDVGFEGVEVTLTWTNPTGGPDLVITTTTDADGMYIFTGLPEGDYTITIDPADLPAGLVPVFDPDDGADNTSAVTLTADVPSDLDQDFSYTGSGVIGDTVWHDRDGDGEIGPGEEPIPGVEVTITYTDPDNGSTFTIVVVTDADGMYVAENLPSGTYVIDVNEDTLPQGYVPTFDADGGDDSTSTIDLGPGEIDIDQDFGFRAEVDLIVVKSHEGDFTVGEENTFNFAVDNLGPAMAEAPVVVTDTLPAGMTFVRSEGADWSCAAAAQIVTCTYTPGALDVTTDSILFDIVVLADPAAAPQATNTAVISTPTVDVDPSNDTTEDVVEVPFFVLTPTKTLVGPLMNGATADYRIDIVNEGPSPTSEPTVIIDDLPAGLAFASFAGDGWTCSASDGLVECENADVIEPGQTVSVTITVNVTAVGGTIITNTATVDGTPASTTDPVEPAPPLPVTGFVGGNVLGIASMLLLAGLALLAATATRRRRGEFVTN